MRAETTPRAAGFRQPAEWEPHAACWLAWPSHGELWLDQLAPVRADFVSMCRALAGPEAGASGTRGEALDILVPDEPAEEAARAALAGVGCRLHRIPFGDIWLRDTAPIFVRHASGEVAAVTFAFNGWGGKYVLPHDAQVAGQVASRSGLRVFRFPWVLEGGSVEVDGEGTCLTTRQCLQNANRNPGVDEATLEARLGEALGVERVLWLDEGLLNDHTDGHIDTLARFVAPGVVVCMEAAAADPNRDVLRAIVRSLESSQDASGRRLEVVCVPSPGEVQDEQGRLLPASYVNFYIGNRAVVVPQYGSPSDEAALERIAALFPGRLTVGVPARAVLSGGGAFHCISQQQPAEVKP